MGNKTLDELLVIVEDAAVTTTASSTGVNINGLAVGEMSHVCKIETGAVTGTVDGSNYYTVALQASDALGGTYVTVGNVVTLPATAKSAEIGFTSEQLNGLVPGADYFRVTTTKVGTTATNVIVTAFMAKV